MSNETLSRDAVILNAAIRGEGKSAIAAVTRRIGLTVAAAMLAGTALVPATAQTFDIGGGMLVVTDFTGPPLNNPTEITNGQLRINANTVQPAFGGNLTDSLGVLTFTKAGSEVVTLSGLNSYAGDTNVLAGTLAAGSATGFSSLSSFQLSGPATLDLAGFDSSIVGLNGNGTVTNSGPAAAVLTLTGTAAGNFAGSITEGPTSPLALVKLGSATQELGGPSSFTGGVTLQDGALRVGNDTALGAGTLRVTGNSSLVTVAMPLITLGNLVDIAAGVQFTVNPSGMGSVLALDGAISGDGSLLKSGAQTLQLNGANTYGGGTNLAGGTVLFGTGNAFGTGAVVVSSSSVIGQTDPGQSLTVANALTLNQLLSVQTPDAGQTLTLSGPITGSFALTLAAGNGGTVALTGANDFGGAQVRVDNGTLRVNGQSALNNGSLRFAGGTGLVVDGAGPVVLGNAILLNGDAAIASANDLTLTNVVSGAGGVAKQGGATLFLTNAGNSFSGAIAIDGGRLEARSGGALGNGVALSAANGTTLAIGTTVPSNLVAASNRAITIAAGGVMTLDLMGDAGNFFLNDADGVANFDGTDLTLNGAVTGGTLNIVGAGRVRLNSASTLEGLNIDQSAVVLGNAGALGGGALRVNEGAVYASTGGAVTLNQNIVVSNNFFIVGSDEVTLNGTVSSFGPVPGELGAIVKIGNGTLRLNGNNTLDNVRLQDGRLVIGTNTALGQRDLNTANFAGTTRTLEAGVDGLQVANNLSIVGPLNVDTAGNTLTLNGQLFNTGSLVKVGAGNLVLTGNNGYAGPTTVNAGTLTAGSDTAFSTGIVTVDGGATLSSQTAPAGGTRTIANNIVLNNGSTVDSNGNVFVLSGLLTGAGTTAKTGAGTLHITGNSSDAVTGFTGQFDVQQGELRLNGSIAGGVTVQVGATLTGSGSAGGTTTLNDTSVLSPGNSPGTLTFGNLVLANGTNLNFELAGLAAVPGTDADLIVVTNNLTLDGVLNITPLAGFNVGVGARTLMTYGNLVANNDVTVSNAPPVDVTYSVVAGPVASGAGIVQLLVGFTGTYRWDGANLVPNGVIDGGSGTLNLTNTNFTNSDGTFNLAYGNNATDDIEFGGTAGGVDVASAINFDQMGFVTTGYVLGGAGSLNVNNSAINVNGNTATINTSITGTNGLAKNGAGLLILNGGNSFTGGLAVNAGTVRIGSNTALGNGSVSLAAGTTLQGTTGVFPNVGNAITLGGAANLDANGGGTTFTGVISGNGPLAVFDVGPASVFSGIALTGNNSFTGNVTVTNTNLVISSDSSLGNVANSLTLNNAFLSSIGNVTTGRAITLLGTERIVTQFGTTVTANGTVGGAGQLIKDGSGTVVLGNAANSYGGGTVITAGTVSIGSDGALGAGGTSVSFSGTPQIGPAPTTLRFTADVTSGRAVAIASGFTGIIDTVANDVRLNGDISGDGALTKIGTGRLTLTGTNSYTGGTNLDVGTLRIEDGQSIGTGLLTTQGGTTFVAGLGAGAGTITLGNNITLAGGQTTIDLNGNLLIINPVTGAVSTNGTNLVLNGTITGAGGFTTSNATAGQIVINGNNSFTGNVNLNSAVVVVNNDNALGLNNTVNINAAAGIRNNTGGTTRTIGSAIAINDPNATVGGNGNIVLTGVVSGSDVNVFNKVGLGTVTLANAANSIAAQIEVAQGELAVTGNLTNANQLTNVRAGATLSGTGSIAGIVEVANAGVLSAGVGGNGQVGRLTIGTLLLNEQSSLLFDLGDNYVLGGPLNDQIAVDSLRLGGRLTVRESAGGSFGLGVYNLFTYNTLLAGSTNVQVQSLPGGFTGLVQTLVPGQVNLIVTQPGTFVQYWDGGDATGNGAVNGGDGTWSATGSNWTGLPDSQLNTSWFNNSVAVFGGAAGTVTLAQLFAAQGLQFVTDGYTLTGGILDNQSTGVGTGMFVATGAAVTATINSTLQGDGILFKQGAGTLALGGNNVNFTGGTQVQAGTLQLNTALAAGTNSIALLGNTTLSNGGGVLSVANNISTAGANSIDSGAGSFTLTGVVSGAGSVIKTGSGTLTLAGSNSYTGGTTVDTGTLAVTNNSSIGTGGLAINGGAIFQAAANGLSFANAVTLNGLATIDTQANDLTLTGLISDGGISGTLVKIGSGNLNLTGANTYSNGTNLNGGSITVFTNSSLGGGTLAMADGTSLIAGANGLNLANAVSTAGVGTINTGTGTLTLDGVISGLGSISKIGAGVLRLTNANSYAGGTALTAGSITVTNDAALGTGALTMTDGTTLRNEAGAVNLLNDLVSLGTSTIETASVLALSGQITGAGNITKIGTGTLVLNNFNLYTGGTNLNAGTIQITNSNALGTGTLLAADGTSLVAGANGLNVGNTVTLAGAVTVDSGTGVFTLSGPVGGIGRLVKINTGNLVLNAANGYTGGTSVNAGTITVGNNSALGTGSVTMANGTTLANNSDGLVVANAFSIGNATVDTGSNTFTMTGVISGAGQLTKTGTGNLVLNGANAYTGGTNVTAGTVTAGNNLAFGTNDVTMASGTTLANNSNDLVIANNFSIGNITVATGANIFTMNGVVSGAGAITKTGSGNLVLNGANGYTGGTALTDGSITVGNNTALGTAGLTMSNGTFLVAGVDGLTIANGITTLAGSTVNTQGFTFTLNGVIDGAGLIEKIGSGNLVLNGANSYTGGTNVVAGTVTAGTNTAFGTSLVQMQSGTTLANNTDNLVIANAFDIGNVTVATGANTFTLAGVVNGTGVLTKTGSGNLILNGANGYTDGTALNAGTITVGTSTALGGGRLTAADGTSLVAGVSGLNVANLATLNGGLTVDSSAGSFELSGVIDGAGSITKVNSGNLILSGSNAFAGGTNLTNGSITFTTNTAFGTGTITTTGGTSLVAGRTDPGPVALTLANNIALGVGTTFVDLQGTAINFFATGGTNFNGTNLTLNGVISGAGALDISDNGRVTLNGANSHAGGTTVTNAALFVGTDSALGTGTLTSNAMLLGNDSGALRTLANNVVLNSGMAVSGPNDITLNGVVGGTSGINKTSTSTLTLNGANTYSGFTSLFGGRITVGSNTALGTTTLTVFNVGQTTTLAAGADNLALANDLALNAGSNLVVESGAGNFTLNGVISGGGSLTKVQAGTLILNGANLFTGGTALNAGTIQVGSNTALGTGTLAMADGTTLQAGVNGLAIANAITTAGSGTVDTQGFTLTLDGVISGVGSLAKIGSGNLVLNGANSYAGGTALNAGTITVATNTALGTGRLTAADGTSLVAGVSGLNLANLVTLNGGLTVDSGIGSFELSGAIDGAGGITKINRGNLILSGVNSYTGGTNLAAGTITVTNGVSLGTGTLTTSGGTTLAAGTGANGPAITLNNAISLGAGTTSLALQGGSMTLFVDAQISTDGTALTLNGPISGLGGLSTIGAGTLTLNGDNSYAGGTTINSNAVVYVGSDTALGTGSITINDLAGLFNFSGATRTLANAVVLGGGANFLGGAADNLVLNGIISGSGELYKVGVNSLVLNGVNTYTGRTYLAAGNLTVGSDSAIGTGVLEADGQYGLGTSLTAGVSGLTIANNVLLSNGANLVIDGGTGSFTLGGVLSGNGSITKVNSGTLVLNGANIYSGGSFINAGTVAVGSNTALGTGIVFMLDRTTLTTNTADLVLSNEFNIGNVTISTGGFRFTFGGPVGGSGLLTKTGAGTLVLNGSNAYGGGTALTAGTIELGNSFGLGSGGLIMSGGTTLLAGIDALAIANSITTLGLGTVNSNGFTITLNGVLDGDGSLLKIGAGSLVLNGINIFTGGTTVSAGTVTAGTGAAFGTGSVSLGSGTIFNTNAANLVFANAFNIGGATVDSGSSSVTLNGVVSGDGLLTKVGSGTLILNGANSFTGGTALNAGTIRVGTGTALGTGTLAMAAGTTLQSGAAGLTLANAIAMADGATVDTNGNTLTLGGVISGTGPLSVIDSAAVAGSALILGGTNSYTGGTIVTGTAVQVAADANLGNTSGGITLVGGTLRTTASFSTARTVALGAGGGTVDTASGTTLTTNGVISGTSLTKIGAGTLVLNGANSHTAGTALNVGQITVGANSALGTGTLTMAGGTTLAAGVTGLTTANNIVTLGAATINSGNTPSAYTISGVISGAGSVTKQGTGVLTVSAANTYTGATTVAAGTLNVTGSLVSGVTVNSGAALTGTGTVASLSVLAGGSVNPGAPGTTDRATLTVTGNATLAGTYTANITTTTNDRIAAGGVLTLGGTLAVAPAVPGGFASFNQTFTVATGASRTGTFASTTGLDQFGIAFNPVVEYTATAANIRLAPQSLVTLGNRFGGVTGNALDVAQAFDRAVAAGYNPQAFFNVYANGGTDLPRTLRQMSGEQRATERRVVLDSNRTIREAALDRLNNGIASMGGQQVTSTDGDKSLTFWLRGAGSWAKAQTGEAATAFTSEQRGILTGLDWKMDGITVGAMFNYTSTDIEYRTLGGSSNVETVGGTVYAGYRKDGGLVVNAGGTLAGSRSNGARAITLPTFQQSLQGRTTGTTYQLFGELAWDLAGAADTRIEPFARLSYVKADFGGLVETGGVAALTAAKQGSDITVTNLGMRFGANVASGKVALNASASWQGTTGDRDALTVIGIPAVGQNFNARSVLMDRSALNLTADAGVNLSDAIRFSLGYSGLIGKRNDDHGARATLNFAF